MLRQLLKESSFRFNKSQAEAGQLLPAAATPVSDTQIQLKIQIHLQLQLQLQMRIHAVAMGIVVALYGSIAARGFGNGVANTYVCVQLEATRGGKGQGTVHASAWRQFRKLIYLWHVNN